MTAADIKVQNKVYKQEKAKQNKRKQVHLYIGKLLQKLKKNQANKKKKKKKGTTKIEDAKLTKESTIHIDKD